MTNVRRRATRACWAAAILLAACNDPSVEPAPPTQAAPAPALMGALPARPLRLGRAPHLAPRATKSEYQPLADYLGKILSHPVEVVVAKDYEGVVAGIADGAFDLAILTPLSYVDAKSRQPALHILASLLAEGGARYHAYIVTKRGGPISTLVDLRGKRIAFVDRGSTSGYLFPSLLLRDAGLSEADFASIEFAGNHPEVVHRVIAGTVDAGAISSTTLAHLRGEHVAGQLEIIGKSESIPFDAVVAHPSLPMTVVERLREALLDVSVRTPEGRQVLMGITTTNGFVLADDGTYEGVRRARALLGELDKP